jgi:hypothetical protein
MVRKGLQPKDHMRENRHMLKELADSAMMRRHLVEVGSHRPLAKLAQFTDVPSRVAQSMQHKSEAPVKPKSPKKPTAVLKSVVVSSGQ